MKKYTIDFQKRGIVIVNGDTKNKEAIIKYPDLGEEIDVPIRYTISSADDRLLGNVNSFIPERNRIEMKNGSKQSTLIIGGNEELILRTEQGRYDVEVLDLEDLVKKEAETLKQSGFSKGYVLRSSVETGKLYFFEKENSKRAILTLDSTNFFNFIPVIMYQNIKEQINGKNVKKKVPVEKSLQIHREVKEGPFVKWVKENFQPQFLDQAFSYQDQEGEKSRFFEYLDHGIKPVVLNGPTGNGKSTLAKEYAFSRGLPFYFDTGNSSFKLSTAIGKFVPSPGNPIFSPGSLTLAAIFGGAYSFEEMAPVPQDEFTGLNIFLQTMELPIITHFGHEVIKANEKFKFIGTGNFHSNYTTNELNDAFLQRFTQIKIGYPSAPNTIDILQSRAPGLDYDTAELITNAVFEMRAKAKKFSKDLGLGGAVEIAQRIRMGTEISMKKLFEENIVNALTTYEASDEGTKGGLHTELMKIVEKYV
jgi:hypothetical protein